MKEHIKKDGQVFLIVKTMKNYELNPFTPEPPVTARADPRPFYPL